MNPRYRATRFLSSAHSLDQLPPDEGREVAFAGRSNAGKSSALNALTGQKALARISKTPGRTQLINLFQVEPGRFLVDLPGYGYAKVPEALRRHWRRTLAEYFERRRSLNGLILLMDIRHPLTEMDRQMLDWSRHRGLPCLVLLTKADKLKRGPAKATLLQVGRALERDHPHAQALLFSAVDSGGYLDPVHARLDDWLGFMPPPP